MIRDSVQYILVLLPEPDFGTSNFIFLLGSGFASDVPAVSAVTPVVISSNGSRALSLALVKHLLQRTSPVDTGCTVGV